MTLQRRVIELKPDSEPRPRETTPLAEYRNSSAWVLLGEPGAGKTEAMKAEAAAVNGYYMTAAQMLIDGQHLPEEWRNKILFIDALDESFHADQINAPLQINSILRRLGKPSYRLSCRVADWKTLTDLDSLAGGYPAKPIVLQLQQLEDREILALLTEKGLLHKERLLEEAREQGLEELLKNPATLLMLAETWKGPDRPDSRKDIYEAACVQLLSEHDPARLAQGMRLGKRVASETLMNSAGQLCATLLLAGKEGIQLQPGRSLFGLYPSLEETGCIELNGIQSMLGSRMWTTVPGADGLLQPAHRSLAEYLAARWLSGAVSEATNPLPARRVSHLLLDARGKVISALRGLYAWLGTLSPQFQGVFIGTDPLTIIHYGDPKSLPLQSKRLLLTSLQQQAEDFYGFRQLSLNDHAFGQLFDSELAEDFKAALNATDRGDNSEAYLACVLSILRHSEGLKALASDLYAVITDPSHWPANQNAALDAWLHITTPGRQKELLQMIRERSIDDPEDELAGRLLTALYPEDLRPDELMAYLHPPKNPRLIGNYLMFFDHLLPKVAPVEHVGELLTAVSTSPELIRPVEGERFHFVDKLLLKALDSLGDQTDDDTLYIWLGAGRDQYGHIRRRNEELKMIKTWLEQRPRRYKSVFARCIKAEASELRELHFDRLHAATPPSDIGIWHLEQAAVTTKQEAKIHVQHATLRLLHQAVKEQLTLDQLLEWQQKHPQYNDVIRSLLVCPLEGWRMENAKREVKWKQESIERRQKRSRQLKPHLNTIAAGKAPAGLMDQLEGVWSGRFSDIRGDTTTARFEAYSSYDRRLQHMAELGFKRCLERDDLPTAKEVIRLWKLNQYPRIGKSCLLGMQLSWEENPESITELSETTTSTLITLELCWPSGNSPPWFDSIATQKTMCFSQTYIAFARASLKAKRLSLPHLYQMETKNAWPEAAAHIAPALLSAFPSRARKEQLDNLRSLMRICNRLAPAELNKICEYKLKLKSPDQSQRVYWQAMAFLLDPESHAKALLTLIDLDQQKSCTLAHFLFGNSHWSEPLNLSGMPISILVTLITQLGPTAEANLQAGAVTAAMERGDQVRSMISLLAAQPTDEATLALKHLIAEPRLTAWRFRLQRAIQEQSALISESRFRFLNLPEVVQVLNNRAPASPGDLAALILYQLDELAEDIRQGNNNSFEAFWNIPEWTKRKENICRNYLLGRLEDRLSSYHITADREVQHHADKRSDMLFTHASFRLPVEVKCDWNPSLWTGLRTQLINRYALQPKAEGHGIYLVLWFGDYKSQPSPLDGGSKPRSPQDLEKRLSETLSADERNRISVRVIDVSRPL